MTSAAPEDLPRPLVGLFCSVRAPSGVILALPAAARALRDAGVAVASGFQSPLERECLEILLRGTQPVVLCPARPLTRLPAAWKAAQSAGRLCFVSPPGAPAGARTTSLLAARRNQFVADIAGALFIGFATPGGKTESLARHAIAAGKPVLVLDDPANAPLLALGARPVTAGGIFAALAMVGSWPANRPPGA